MFVIESFEWLHWWHSHDNARRVADRSSGISLREGEGESRRVRHANLEEKIIQFLFVEFILLEGTS